MGNHMTRRQKMISYTLNFYVTSILMYMITQNVVANIMASYPEVADYTVKSLTTLPTLFGLLATFAMGPIAMRFDKVKLLVIVMCSMGIFSLIFFANGVMHGPFELYYVAVVFGGFAQGSFAPLMNLIIGETFDEADRAGRIASYNVTNNVGAFFVLLISGRIAATNDGANWPYGRTGRTIRAVPYRDCMARLFAHKCWMITLGRRGQKSYWKKLFSFRNRSA